MTFLKKDAPLNANQYRLLVFIKNYMQENGFAPSFDEMRVGLGYKSVNPICRLCDNLEQRKWIKRAPGKPRSIILIRDAPHDPWRCPHCGGNL